MKFHLLLLLFLGTTLLYAQDTTKGKSFSSTLSLGEVLEFADKSVKFRKVVSDSRCPQNVNCIWAGEAKIMVEVYEQGKSCGTELLTLAVGAGLPQFLHKFFPEQHILISDLILAPYPKAGLEIDSSQYTLDLEVSTRENSEK